jgi:hypothetical protein
MKLSAIEQSPDGAIWVCVGYSPPRRRDRGGVYRYIRASDGARIRIPSNKFFECNISRANWKEWTAVLKGHNETVSGGGAAGLQSDQLRAVEIMTNNG